MAAGLGFKDFQTGEVLTAADVDGYLMQGVWVFASAAARDAAVTSPQEGNFAYLKDTNVTTYYTGSAWANLDTTGMTNPMTTTGDIIYSSSGSTPARLGIGSTGDVLTVAGGVPSWAAPASGGGMTLLSTTTLSGSSTTISISPTGYQNLFITIENVIQASGGGGILFDFNATGDTISYVGTTRENTTNAFTGGSSDGNLNSGSDLNTSGNNAWFLLVSNPNSTTSFKPYQQAGGWVDNAGVNLTTNIGGIYRNNSAISSIIFTRITHNFSSGTVKIYGVK